MGVFGTKNPSPLFGPHKLVLSSATTIHATWLVRAPDLPCLVFASGSSTAFGPDMAAVRSLTQAMPRTESTCQTSEHVPAWIQIQERS